MADERKKDSMDDFWDIESLIPPKKEKNRIERVTVAAQPAQIDLEKKESGEKTYKSEPISSTEFKRFIPPFTEKDEQKRPAPEREYKREGSLIRAVRIYNTQTKYPFYERFYDDARSLWGKKGVECAHVPFFSYSPQYVQMNKNQISYYLWWRENFRNGVCLDADYSYIMLYLYEIINLSDTLAPEYCLDEFCKIWLSYGKQHKFISKYLCEWVCDLCLLHDLPVPADRIRTLYPEIMQNCTLKEFYALCEAGGNTVCAQTLMSVSGVYDYTKSKFATSEHLPIMEKYLTGALRKVLKTFAASEKVFISMGRADNQMTRNSYTGALCTAKIKRKIEVEYYSFSHSHELRYLVSDILKYAENKLRGAFKIKSRLSIYALPTPMKECIDEYFSNVVLVPQNMGVFDAAAKKSKPEPEYERLYQIPNKPLSLEAAQRIENDSWDVTKILVEAFETEETEPEPVFDETKIEENDLISALGERLGFVLAVLKGDVVAQRKESEKLGILADALVDEINELAADAVGDILIEEGDDGYEIIEDYKELVEVK